MSEKIRQADTTVEKNDDGSTTVSAMVPGEMGPRLYTVTYYGFTQATAEREYRRTVNEKLDERGWV